MLKCVFRLPHTSLLLTSLVKWCSGKFLYLSMQRETDKERVREKWLGLRWTNAAGHIVGCPVLTPEISLSLWWCLILKCQSSHTQNIRPTHEIQCHASSYLLKAVSFALVIIISTCFNGLVILGIFLHTHTHNTHTRTHAHAHKYAYFNIFLNNYYS